MRRTPAQKPSWILQPAVSLTIAYGGVITCWFLYLLATASYPTIFHRGPYRLIETKAYWAFTLANAGLAIWLLMSFGAARGSDRSVRRGQLAGITGSLLFLAVLQFGAQALHRDFGSNSASDPLEIEAFVERQGEAEIKVIARVRYALKKAYPELREALFQDTLVYQNEGNITHRLNSAPGTVRLNLYEWSQLVHPIDEGPWALEIGSNLRETELVIHCPLDDEQLNRLYGAILTLPRRE